MIRQELEEHMALKGQQGSQNDPPLQLQNMYGYSGN